MSAVIEDLICHFNSPDQRGSKVTKLPARNSPAHTATTPKQIEENEIMVLVEQFGFEENVARSLVQYNKYLKDMGSLAWIPRSLLVQTFMRKLQDGMDRRRP